MPDRKDVPDQEARTPDPRNRDAGSSQCVLTFLLGMLVGGLVDLIAPVLWSAFLLAPSRVEETLVAGVMTDKQESSNRVLLRIESDSGLVVASFADKRMLVELLVDSDTVTVSMPVFARIVEEAHLTRVVNAESPTAAERDTTDSLESRPD